MIILSFIVFVIMFVWMVASILGIVLGLFLADGNLEGFVLFCGCVFSLVCWYQVLVWGEPWFRVLASAWM